MGRLDESGQEEVNRTLAHWRQGDCAVSDDSWFVFRAEASRPLSAEAEEAGFDVVESQERGFAVITQTCDIVRDCVIRPYLELCPLVEVDATTLGEVERGTRPNYAFLPGLSDRCLVADLDRVMTVEKTVIASSTRIEGTRTDVERRRLSQALARKRARMAFPDDFVHWARPLVRRLSSKHDKNSDEGRALRSLREIRVRGAPSWSEHEPEIEVFFWFIRNTDESTFEGTSWDSFLESWLSLLTSGDRFKVEGVVTTLDDMTGREYVESDPLDLDHLSTRMEPQTSTD